MILAAFGSLSFHVLSQVTRRASGPASARRKFRFRHARAHTHTRPHTPSSYKLTHRYLEIVRSTRFTTPFSSSVPGHARACVEAWESKVWKQQCSVIICSKLHTTTISGAHEFYVSFSLLGKLYSGTPLLPPAVERKICASPSHMPAPRSPIFLRVGLEEKGGREVAVPNVIE